MRVDRERFGSPAVKDVGPASTETALPSFSETNKEPVYLSPNCHSTSVHEERHWGRTYSALVGPPGFTRLPLNRRGPSQTAAATPFFATKRGNRNGDSSNGIACTRKLFLTVQDRWDLNRNWFTSSPRMIFLVLEASDSRRRSVAQGQS